MKKRIKYLLTFLLCIFALIILMEFVHAVTPATKSGEGSEKSTLTVVFISSNIQNAKAIGEVVMDEAVTIIYDFAQTDLLQINFALDELTQREKQKIDHLIFLCHGAPGNIVLGADKIIDSKEVKKNHNEWRYLSNFLSENGKIDFYGNEIGLGDDGKELVNAISRLTGASVRASNNPTGNIHDADWELETKTSVESNASPVNFSLLTKAPVYF